MLINIHLFTRDDEDRDYYVKRSGIRSPLFSPSSDVQLNVLAL